MKLLLLLKLLVIFIFIEKYAVNGQQYFPCQSWISFSFDDSNTLNANNFLTQLYFISSAIAGINHPERIQVVGAFSEAVIWNSGLSNQQIRNSVVNAPQGNGPYNLRAQFAELVTNIYRIENNTVPTGALVFISDTSDAALAGAEQFMNQLSGIQLTFILLGPNADALKLTDFSSNFIFWSDLSKPQPDNWDTLLFAAYGCNTVATPSPSLPTTGVPYYPCQSWISLNIDDSNKLDPYDFVTQLNFISSIIGSLNHFERIQAVGAYYEPVSWNNDLSLQQIQTAIDLTKQGGPYRLRNTLATLLTTLGGIQAGNIPIGAMIFISDTSVDALAGADQFINILSNVRITFVLLGPDADASKLTKFSNNFIYWTDLSQPEPLNWNAYAGPAYGCINVGTLTTPATTTTSPPSTVNPYISCKNWISFSYDDSNTLKYDNFKTQMDLISSTLKMLKYPNSLRVEGAYTEAATWNSGLSISHIQTNINSINQSSISYSLLQQFGTLLTGVNSLGETEYQIGALIFISDTSDFALSNAYRLFSGLNNVEFTFVLLGPNVDASKLTNFSSNFIYWSDLKKPQPDNWDSLSLAAYGCSNWPTPTPYIPCQSWISFGYDDSNVLNANDFKTQLAFISTAIGALNYSNRLQIYGAYTGVASWNSGTTIDHMQSFLNSTEQTANPYSLLQEFATLLTGINSLGTTTWPIGALIFISDTSDNALANADHIFPQLSGKVRLTFVLLGLNADLSKLTQFSNNFIYWTDLSQPQPDNWNIASIAAYGCSKTTLAPSTFSPTIPYVPCQSWISFSFDDSNILDISAYSNQIDFIVTAFGSLNHPERIRAGGVYNDLFDWTNVFSISQQQTILKTTNQTQMSFDLSQQFSWIANDIQNLEGTNFQITALVFVSDTSDAALAGANHFLYALENVQLTFIMLGPNVDSSKLTQFSSNFLNWPDLTEPQPENWNPTTASVAYGCSKNFNLN